MKKNEQPLHELITAHLSECKRHIDADVYYKALAAIKNAKYSDPRNIFIIALEKQVELLSELSNKRPGSSSNKKEIREPIPGIIRHAIDDAHQREEDKSNEVQSSDKDEPLNDPVILERNLAITKLKNQFVKLAEEYIDRGNYKSALEEIRRIFIIDPDNEIAGKLEKKIETLESYRTNNEVKQEPKPKEKKEKKRVSIGKVVLLAIALLIMAGVLFLYLKSMVSTGDAEPIEYLSESDAGSVSSDSHRYASEENRETVETESEVSQSSVSHPDAAAEYREIIPVPEENPALIIEDSDEGQAFASSRVSVDIHDVSVKLEEPDYPNEALELGIEGDVVIRVRYDSTGTVNASIIDSTDHPLLSGSALESARQSIILPADTIISERDEWVSIFYHFRLER